MTRNSVSQDCGTARVGIILAGKVAHEAGVWLGCPRRRSGGRRIGGRRFGIRFFRSTMLSGRVSIMGAKYTIP
jgi:hypothetical protein